MKRCIIILALAVMWVPSAMADTLVRDVEFCAGVESREPVDRFSPTAACFKPGDEISWTIVNADRIEPIYFWNKISSDSDEEIIHSWFKKDDADSSGAIRTEYRVWERKLCRISEIKVDNEWLQIAMIAFKTLVSDSYRLWSSKIIDPRTQKGDWEVRVSTKADPDKILCTGYLRVQ